MARSVRAAVTWVAALGVALTLGGCSSEGFDPRSWGAPGENTHAGPVLIRYAHLAEPVQGEPWKRGDDVSAYVWLFNEGRHADTLLGASSPAASSVGISDPDGTPRPKGVRVPAGGLVELKPGKPRLVLHDVRRTIRGGDFVKVTLRFERAGRLTLNLQALPPGRRPSFSPLPARSP